MDLHVVIKHISELLSDSGIFECSQLTADLRIQLLTVKLLNTFRCDRMSEMKQLIRFLLEGNQTV